MYTFNDPADIISTVFGDILNPVYNNANNKQTRRPFSGKFQGFEPAINIIEAEDSYKIEIAAPGANKNDVSIKLNSDNELEIAVAKTPTAVVVEEKEADVNADKANGADDQQEEKKQNTERYLRKNFDFSEFSRTFYMPEDVQADKIGAKVQDGVISILLPKQAPKPKEDNSRVINID